MSERCRGLSDVAVMMGGGTFGAEMVPRQVDQRPSDLQRRQSEELAHRARTSVLQRAIQPEGRLLHHVVGLFPALQPRISPKHLPRQLQQPRGGSRDDFCARSFVASCCLVQQILQFDSLRLASRHEHDS